ncbi:MAG: hypothetical protein ACRDUY_15815 [Nitriliruptorales bacterium]
MARSSSCRGSGGPAARARRARFLAAQRLAAARVPDLVYVGSSVAALGVLLYALVAQQSLDRTIDSKIMTIVGADVAADVPSGRDRDRIDPGPFRSPAVYRTAVAFSDGARVEVLAVDPQTFADVAGGEIGARDLPLAD